ncbi:hypothetical protein [Pseudoalteromonas piscicida]|uniref:Carrier domain-containing protein n=1 Tax=Pseudoalteromonas piscicida TaxID=43662 RepID=A0A2A5JVM0_PSEO7|nr:hypothetical protein [Pseudoalteromonas piscicida]PCK33397.1 hypothetical protein CEX98_02565 [Pseudoalteromonas piscicida]
MNANKEMLTQTIQQFLLERGVIVADNNIDSYNFVKEGTLDSFEILTLIMQLESDYRVSVPPELLLDPENANVGTLVNSLAKLVNDRDKS